MGRRRTHRARGHQAVYCGISGRFREHERATHNASIEAMAGKIDGLRANTAHIRSHLRGLGVSEHDLAMLELHEPGEPLAPVDTDHVAASRTDDDQRIAAATHAAIERGDRVDIRRLTAGQFAALMTLRGAS